VIVELLGMTPGGIAVGIGRIDGMELKWGVVNVGTSPDWRVTAATCGEWVIHSIT
jgi:hypothetical protein